MDENLKKKIAMVKSLIQKKQYKQALDELQVLMYKYAKAYQVHLLSGLCYEKVGREQQAKKCYMEVIDLKDDEPNAIKALCEIYTKRADIKNATIYLEKNVEILRKADDAKYRQAVVKLVDIYRKDQNLEKVHSIFMQYIDTENQIGEDFVSIADAYFRVSTNCKSFNLQTFELMGIHKQLPRPLLISAREKLNLLLIDIVQYLSAVSLEYHLTQKDIANSLYEMKYHFPTAPCMLMLMLLDEYCVGQVGFSQLILEEVYKLLAAHFRKEDNGYLNMEFTEPEIFTVEMVLGYEYLAFFRQFFTLDTSFEQFFEPLAQKQQTLMSGQKVREEYSRKINNFILKKCRHLNKVSQTKNVETEIEEMKKRIMKLEDSYLQQVIAKIGMNCFVNYQKLDDMKNMLKVRIKNLQEGDMVPHLYKYYVEYLLKIARIYKVLDEEIDIYQAILYINQYDPNDLRFLVEGHWLTFCKAMLLQEHQQKVSLTLEAIAQVEALICQTTNQLKADSLRRIAVMKVFSGNFDVQNELKLALSLDRCFANLQSMGFYCFHMKRQDEALNYLKEAFVLNQTHYHTNRLIFVLLFRLGHKNEAIDFVQRIKEGFRSVFWVNYVLALKYTNSKKFIEAESYLSTAIECFTAGCQKKYKFSYQKTVPHQHFAFLYMVQQNRFSILYDELIFPENVIYQELKMVSSLHFEKQTKNTQIKLFLQMGELLKVLGRTKSALNYLAQAFSLSQEFTEEEKNFSGQRFQICLLHKEYATLLFYMQMFRQCEIVIMSAYKICQEELEAEKDESKRKVLETIESEIDSLSFEVAVQRLSIMSRFESHETVEEYLQRATVRAPNHPSVNFLKGKYQFYILEYLHRRKDTEKVFQGIYEYLRYFGLPLINIQSSDFENRYCELDYEQKLMVKESLEDYFVVRYISEPSKLTEKQIMPLIQLFPRSTILYIIFGMSTPDIKLKTAAFLKCIQLDKESPISIDLLASLYLKQKNYLAATKLFLKSLQMDILNSKCYLGLSICLFCIIGQSISAKDQDAVQTVHKALVRINSYMEYLRTVDPSQNYHLLKFLKLLVNDEPLSNFTLKTTLQASKRNAVYKYRNTLVYELLEQATHEWKEHNIWQQEGQVKIVEEFVGRFYEQKPQSINENSLEIAVKIVENGGKQLKELEAQRQQIKHEYLVKEIQRTINQFCIAANLAMKAKFDSKLLDQLIHLLTEFQHHFQRVITYSEENTALIRKLKSYLFQYTLINSHFNSHKLQIKSAFQQIPTYDHLTKYPHLIVNYQSELFREVLTNPSNDQLKKIISQHMVVNGGKKLNKGKYDYKVELVNNTHDNLSAKKQTLKKLCILYRDPESYVGYVQMCWQEPNARTKTNIEKWLGLLAKLGQTHKARSGNYLAKETELKLNTLKLQILSFYVVKFGESESLKKLWLTFTKEEEASLQVLKLLDKFYIEPSSDNLKLLKPLITGAEYNFPLTQLLSFFTNTYAYSDKIQSLLIQLADSSPQGQPLKAHLLLVRYLYVLYRPVRTEEDLIRQITDLEKLIHACAEAGVSENTVSILNCSKCLVSADYHNLEIELGNSSKKRIVTYSDQVLINFFQIMRLYKEVEANPNKEGVIEEFAIYVEQMILLVKDPFYQGFFHSLKALVNSMIVPDESFVHDRNLRMAMILSPHGSKVFLKSPEL